MIFIKKKKKFCTENKCLKIELTSIIYIIFEMVGKYSLSKVILRRRVPPGF